MMLATRRQLAEAGVLGINRRNARFTLPCNPRKYYPRVDDKEQTKQLAQEAGMAVPPLYGVLHIERQVRDLARQVAPYADFVIKPAQGSGGNGILVITGRTGSGYRLVNGVTLDERELAHHASNVLSGMYSLGGQPDKALIEYRVQFDPVFAGISYQGVPDIRIINYLGVPVMAMIRLPTQRSRGRANLHQGAIGAGVDLATGTTLHAVQDNAMVTMHPDTGNAITGITIPYWDQILALAARCYELTGLGYQGADFVLDSERGPLLLELNARPGLNIQIANHAGLLPRLRQVERSGAHVRGYEQRVGFAKRAFAHKEA
jgi:alpha-L-glutamate ligase-like protein